MTQAFIDSLNGKRLYISSYVEEGEPHFDERIVLVFEDGIIYYISDDKYELCSVEDIIVDGYNENKFRYKVESGKFDIVRFSQDIICHLLENGMLDILDEWLDDEVPLYCILQDNNEITYKEHELKPMSWWV